jgi:2-amino-4-hydroxy-6-hydroxymethyldihydropteridine diphosphokinase
LPDLAFISLGSNIDPELHLPEAIARLDSVGRVLRTSTAYRNPAVGPGEQPDFINAAALVQTSMTALELRDRLRQIEAGLGRVRQPDRFAPRPIDLDLCYLGETDEEFNGWSLPDREADKLAYLAIPLAELDPEFRHPKTGETLTAIAERLRPGAHLQAEPSIVLGVNAV